MNRIALISMFIGIVFSGNADAQDSEKPKPLSNASVDTPLCAHLSITAQSYAYPGGYQRAYDTARAFIEHCASATEAARSLFLDLDGYNSFRSDDLHRFEEYREWLKKVLYYNTDTLYYCQDVHSILTTFHWFNDQRGTDGKGGLAVLNYILQSGKCPGDSAYIDTALIPNTWTALYNSWYDTVKNQTLTPFDSTLPTLEDLDLGILRGNPAGVHDLLNPHSSTIASLIASENPFKNETSLIIDANDAVLLHLEIFDVLGRKLFTNAKFFQEGRERWMIDGKDLPRGTIYARISTLSGEARTVKLVHE